MRGGGPANDTVYDVARRGDGCVVVGTFQGSLAFGDREVTGRADQRPFVAIFDADARCTEVRVGTGPGVDSEEAIPYEVAVADEAVFVAGWFRYALHFGDVEIRGGYDQHFVAKLLP
jgi:hypothetical protein